MRGGWTRVVAAFVIGALLAGAATATAAKLITSRDIKDGTIAPRDLSKQLRSQLGAAGTAGPRGAAGEKGAPGSAGAPGTAGAPGPEGDRTHVVTKATKAFTATGGSPSPFTTVTTIPGIGSVEASCFTYPDLPDTMYKGIVRFRNTTGDVVLADGQAVFPGTEFPGPDGNLSDLSTQPPDTYKASREITILNTATDRAASVIIYLRLSPSPLECEIRTYHRVRTPAG